jgi:hypothetical protein
MEEPSEGVNQIATKRPITESIPLGNAPAAQEVQYGAGLSEANHGGAR